ncbi:MAG: tetratricopeptide repeat protein [Pseudomonadota bacterium]
MIDMQSGAASRPFIKDTDELKFEQDVLAESMSRPVVVCFWSTRSAPCKQMMPVFEKGVGETGGTVAMVRVDIDRNRELAQMMHIQSVPAVYAFHQGKPVDGFAGVRTEADLRIFVDKLAKLAAAAASPDEAVKLQTAGQVRKLMEEGDQFFQKGSLNEAMERYGCVLEADASNAEAMGGIGWSLLSQGEAASVREMLAEMTPEQMKSPRLQGLRFILSLEEQAAGLEDIPTLENKILEKPKDLQAHYDLALRTLAAGQVEKGVDTLIALIRINRDWEEMKARKLLLEIFEALGPTHPLTVPGRRKLSAILFS